MSAVGGGGGGGGGGETTFPTSHLSATLGILPTGLPCIFYLSPKKEKNKKKKLMVYVFHTLYGIRQQI